MAGPSKRTLDLLLIRLSSFGDIVLAEPVARTLKGLYPDSRLVFATRPEYAGLPALFSAVDSVSTYGAGRPPCAYDELRTGRVFDIVVDLQANLNSRRMIRHLRARRVLRHRKPRFGRFFTVYLPWVWKAAQPHTLETYFRTLEPLGVGYSGEVPRIDPTAEMLTEVTARVGTGPFVGICPGSSSEHKSWGEGRFADLASLLAEKQDIMVVGAEQDRAVVERILQRIPGGRISTYVGDNIGRIAACLSLCSVTVTNDSGLMHLAGAVGSRPVAIFGPTSPLLGFAPAAEGAVVLTLDLPCSPCSYHGNKPCRLERRACMEDITPEHVASTVGRMIGEL
jgi:heptosyltransferase-2